MKHLPCGHVVQSMTLNVPVEEIILGKIKRVIRGDEADEYMWIKPMAEMNETCLY